MVSNVEYNKVSRSIVHVVCKREFEAGYEEKEPKRALELERLIPCDSSLLNLPIDFKCRV